MDSAPTLSSGSETARKDFSLKLSVSSSSADKTHAVRAHVDGLKGRIDVPRGDALVALREKHLTANRSPVHQQLTEEEVADLAMAHFVEQVGEQVIAIAENVVGARDYEVEVDALVAGNAPAPGDELTINIKRIR